MPFFSFLRTNQSLNTAINPDQQEPITLPQSLCRKLASDTIIVILDFYGGSFEVHNDTDHTKHRIDPTSDSSNGALRSNPISQVIGNCFGRFKIDSSIKFAFRYGIVETTMSFEALIFICTEQCRQVGCSVMGSRLLKALCECPLKNVISGQTLNRRITINEEKEKEILDESLEKLTQFKREHPLICQSFKELDFYAMETYRELIEKCIEIFPNFERLSVGFPRPPPTKVYVPETKRKYYLSNNTLKGALEKSNRKCKLITSYGYNILEGETASQFPVLEEYNLIGDYSVKSIGNIDQLKQLKVLKFNYSIGRGYEKSIRYSLPSFFQSLAKCNLLTILKIPNEQLFGEEFIHLSSNLPNLRYLSLKGCGLKGTTEVFETIGTFHNLKILILPDHEDDQVFEKLLTLTQLQYLESESTISSRGVQSISRLTSLKSLIISSLHISNKEGKVLINLKNLEQFRFNCGNTNHFSTKLILYLFKNLNVKTYEINYYHKDVEKLPEKIKDRMRSHVTKATEKYKEIVNL